MGTLFWSNISFEKLFLLDILNKLPNFIKHFYTMFLVIIGFVLFEIDNLNGIYNYLISMFNFKNIIIDKTFIYYLVPNISSYSFFYYSFYTYYKNNISINMSI